MRMLAADQIERALPGDVAAVGLSWRKDVPTRAAAEAFRTLLDAEGVSSWIQPRKLVAGLETDSCCPRAARIRVASVHTSRSGRGGDSPGGATMIGAGG
jgi:hypothetical protein